MTADPSASGELAEIDRLVDFVDQHRKTFGVAPICTIMQVAPSTYYTAKAQAALATPADRRGAHG